MAISWDAIKQSVATAIGAALAADQAASFAQFPTPAVALSATLVWNGTATVLTDDTSELSADPPDFIRLDSDSNWFRVSAIEENVFVTIENVYSVSIPSGSGTSSKSLGAVPSPPSSNSLAEKLGQPIADAVFDGVQTALTQAEIVDVAYDDGNVVGPGVII